MASKKQIITLEGAVRFDGEDGGSTIEASIIDNCMVNGVLDDESDEGLIVRLQSWDERRKSPRRHEVASLLDGRRVRVTIETID